MYRKLTSKRLVKLLAGSFLGGSLILGTLPGMGGSLGQAQAAPAGAPPASKQIDGKNYSLVWSEECNGNNTFDPAWRLQKTAGSPPPENGAMVYKNKVSTKTDAYDLDSNLQALWGHCTLRAVKNDNLGQDKLATSAGISTNKAWKYGHFEARMRFPTSPGTWPALWLMPESNPYGWPRDGEIDWIEYARSANPHINQTNLHTSSVTSNRGQRDSSTRAFSPAGNDLGAQWHVWSMDWDQEGFVFKLDGVEYGRISRTKPLKAAGDGGNVDGANNRWFSSWYMDGQHRPINDNRQTSGNIHKDPADSMAPFDKKFFLILNLGIKKKPQWAGANPTEFDWPQAKVDVDYIRVYQTEEQKRSQNDVFLRYDTGPKADSPAEVTLQVGNKYGDKIPTLVSKDGTQIARHWYSRPDLNPSLEVTANTVVEKDLVLFPKWETRPNYSVSFDKGGHGADSAAKSVKAGESVALPTLSEAGWRFDGWFADAQFKKAVSSPYTPSANVTLYAKWTSISPAAAKPELVIPKAPDLKSARFKDVAKTAPFFNEIGWMGDTGYSTGWADGTYRPYQTIDRNAMIAFIYRLSGSPAVDLKQKPSFKDVQPGAPFYKEIQWAAKTGVTKGWSDGTFRPYEKVNRDAMAAFMYRLVHDSKIRPQTIDPKLADLSMFKQRIHFKDVADNPFKKEIEWCAKAGISNGWPDGTFRPYQTVERNAMAAFVFRLSHNHVVMK